MSLAKGGAKRIVKDGLGIFNGDFASKDKKVLYDRWKTIDRLNSSITSTAFDFLKSDHANAVKTISSSSGGGASHSFGYPGDTMDFVNVIGNKVISAYNTANQNKNNGNPSIPNIPYSTVGSMPNSASTSFNDALNSPFQQMADRNNQLSLGIMRENNKFNADQAQIQRDWQQNMANTAHQREVADLKAAGLNPVLSAGGSGSVTPSGAMASNASYSNVSGDSVIGALTSLAAAAMSANATTTAASIGAAANMYGSKLSYDAADLTSKRQQENVDLQSGRSMYGMFAKILNWLQEKTGLGEIDF